MTLAEEIVSDYLHKLRGQFYADDDKKFYQQKAMLVTAITYLAVWLDKRSASIPDRRYRKILDEVIRTIQHHGDTAKIGYFCRYFLKAVQTHVDHHGDEYFDEAKDFRNALDNIRGKLSIADARKVQEAKEETTAQLARFGKLVKGGRPKGSGKRPPSEQASFGF